VILADQTQLWMYSLRDGTLIRCVTYCPHIVKGIFGVRRAGVCMAPDDDSVLITETTRSRIQQVCVRFVGEGRLHEPAFVACNSAVLAVSEWKAISVWSWLEGTFCARIAPGGLFYPFGLRMLPDGSGVVVCNPSMHALYVFGLDGLLRHKFQHTGRRSLDVICWNDTFIVSDRDHDALVQVSGDDGTPLATYGTGSGEFRAPSLVAALPCGGLVVVDQGDARFQILRVVCLRQDWVAVCVQLARQGHAALC
jgi:hypothetical protein